MRRAIWPVAALSALLGTGCGLLGGGQPKPTAMEVTLTSADRLNPDERGESLPTVFRIYLLASAAKAEAAGYEELYRGPEVLGDDALAADEVVLSPGESVKRLVAAERPARALLVVGVFRKPSGASWRVLVPIEKGRPRAVTVRAEDYRVEWR